MVKKWIKEANLEEGAFTKKAKAAGMGVQEYAAHVVSNKDRYDTETVRQANLARTFKRMGTKVVKKGRRIS